MRASEPASPALPGNRPGTRPIRDIGQCQGAGQPRHGAVRTRYLAGVQPPALIELSGCDDLRSPPTAARSGHRPASQPETPPG
jgi:hypothetical protein